MSKVNGAGDSGTNRLGGQTVFALSVAASDLVFFAAVGAVVFDDLAFGVAIGVLVAAGIWLLTPAAFAGLGSGNATADWRSRRSVLGVLLVVLGVAALLGRLVV